MAITRVKQLPSYKNFQMREYMDAGHRKYVGLGSINGFEFMTPDFKDTLSLISHIDDLVADAQRFMSATKGSKIAMQAYLDLYDEMHSTWVRKTTDDKIKRIAGRRPIPHR